MAGVEIVTVQGLLGHKTIAMTRRYSSPTPKHKKKAIELSDIDTSSDTSQDFTDDSAGNTSFVTN